MPSDDDAARLREDIDRCWVPLYHAVKLERDRAEVKLARVEAVLDEHGQWYSGPLLYRALCEALAIEPK
jgi:hypothetical protein